MVVPNIMRVHRNILLFFGGFFFICTYNNNGRTKKKMQYQKKKNVYFATTQNLFLKDINNRQKHSKYSGNIYS